MRRNFIYQIIYQLTVMIMPILTVPIVTNIFGAGGIGVWNYIYSIVTYFVVFSSLGLANYGTREISVVSHDKKKRSQKFWELEIFNLLFVLITAVVYFLCTYFFFPYKLYFYIMALAVLSSIFDVSWFFLGISDFYRIALYNVIIKLLTFFSIVIFVKSKEDFNMYVMIQALSIFASQFIFFVLLRKKIYFCLPKLAAISQHFYPASIFFISKVSSSLFLNINKTLLGVFATMSAVGIYSNSLILVQMSTGILNAINAVMLPRMSKLMINRSNKKKILLELDKSIHFQLFLSIAMAFGISLINKNMINWLFNEQFNQMLVIVPIMAASIVLQTFYNCIAIQYLIPKNEMKSYNLSIVIGLIVTVILSSILIPIIGIYGAVLSYIIGQFSIAIYRYVNFIKQEQFSFRWRMLIWCLLSGVVMYIVTDRMTIYMPQNIVTTFIQVGIGVCIYLLLTIPLLYRKEIIKCFHKLDH